MPPHTQLYVIPTPIGNLQDITLRALETLQQIDTLLCEDTRHTRKLLSHFSIHTPTERFDAFTEHKKVEGLLVRMQAEEVLGLASDAGTPGISDPCFLLVNACIAQGLRVECLPGATALIPALILSGLPSDRFAFEGFLPHKKGRSKKLDAIAQASQTCILYESPQRLLQTLRDLQTRLGEKQWVSVSRELTKKHEETIRAPLHTLITHFTASPPKGECVVVFKPAYP